MLRLLLALVLLAAVGGWFWPQMQEEVDTPCAAMERRFAALMEGEVAKLPGAIAGDTGAGRLLAQLREAGRSGTGAAGRAYAAQRFPDLPPDIACAIAWWQMYLAADLRSALRALAPR